MEGRGRRLILDVITAFSWKDWGKSRKTSIEIPCLRAEIWTLYPLLWSVSANHSAATFGEFYVLTDPLIKFQDLKPEQTLKDYHVSPICPGWWMLCE
jgi:hypothetical protein